MPQRLVVVVDDEPDLRRLICDVLQDDGFSVIGFPQPSLALSMSGNENPSVFLLDLMLPEMTGIELAHHLRERGFASATLIALSASGAMLRRAADSRLFQDTMRKPFDIEELLDRVRAHAA